VLVLVLALLLWEILDFGSEGMATGRSSLAVVKPRPLRQRAPRRRLPRGEHRRVIGAGAQILTTVVLRRRGLTRPPRANRVAGLASGRMAEMSSRLPPLTFREPIAPTFGELIGPRMVYACEMH
jgi:hypothetical protein